MHIFKAWIRNRLRYMRLLLRATFPRLSHPNPGIAIEDRAWRLAEHLGGVEAIRGVRWVRFQPEIPEIRAEEVDGLHKVAIEYRAQLPYTVEDFFNVAFLDAANVIPRLFIDKRVTEVSLARFADFADRYGQLSENWGCRITITRAGFNKLNWSDTHAENLWLISGSGDRDIQVALHPTLLKELNLELP